MEAFFLDLLRYPEEYLYMFYLKTKNTLNDSEQVIGVNFLLSSRS